MFPCHKNVNQVHHQNSEEEENRQASEMMDNHGIQIREDQTSGIPQHSGEISREKQLELLLHQMLSKAVKELCFEYKFEKKNNPSSDDDILMKPKLFVSIQRPDDSDVGELALALPDQRKQHGRKIKNNVTGEKVVCFEIPEDFDVEAIENIGEIKDRLGKWRIQRRQRESYTNDTYYCHLISRQTFRSMPEVLNFIMRGTQNKANPKRSATDMASTSEVDNMMMTIYESPSKEQRKDEGKMVLTSQESMSPENTTFSNSELSMVPWRPQESEMMNMNYYHVSSRQIQYWTPKPINFLLYEPEANLISRDKNKVIIQEMENFVDLTQDSVDEHGIYSNLEMTTEVTVQDKVDNSTISESPLKRGSWEDIDHNTVEAEAFNGWEMLLGDITFEDLLGEINNYGVTPRANYKDIGNDYYAENPALITTDPVESLIFTESSNKPNQNLKDSGPAEKFATLEKAKQKLAGVELEGVDVDDDHFQHGGNFSEPDSVNHLLNYDYDYGIEFLFRD